MIILLYFISFSQATTLWALSGSGTGAITKSTDDGATFTNLPTGTNSNLKQLWAKSATEIWAVGNAGTVRKTLDGGSTWTTVSIGTTANLNQNYWISLTTGWIAGVAYFSRTSDSGATWTTTTTAGFGADAVFFLDANNGVAVSGTGLFGTINAGATWGALTIPTSTNLKSINFPSTSVGVAVGLSGTIIRTANGGVSWTQITSPVTTILNYVMFTSSTVGWIAHSAGLLKTIDAGATWTTVTLPSGGSFTGVVYSSTSGWLFGGSLQTSVNSGTTWSVQTNPFSPSTILSLTVNGAPLPTTTTTTGTSTPPPVTYQVTQFFSNDLTCSNAFTAMQVAVLAACTPSTTCTNVAGNYGSKVSCVTTPPQYPAGWAALEVWLSSSSCTGTSDGILVAPADTCTGKWSLATMQMNCSNNVILDCGATVSSCGGCSSKSATKGGSCVTGNPISSLAVQSYKWTCTSGSGTVCFHESSILEFPHNFVQDENFRTFTMNSIPKECVIPHIVKTDGIIIDSECDKRPLRVTPDHLVFTDRGLIAAEKIMVGDHVIGYDDYHCKVLMVAREKNQMYYGLNCRESVVYANGVKCSVFGKMHVIPALWMRFVSYLFGIEVASKYGDYLAKAYAHVFIPHIGT